jgi:hypothetical protein
VTVRGTFVAKEGERMRGVVLVVTMGFAIGASAVCCSSSTEATSSTPADAAVETTAADATVGADGGANAPLACEPDKVDDFAAIESVFTNEVAPAPAGGKIAEGRYVMTKQTLYFGGDASLPSNPPPDKYRHTTEIAGDEIRRTAVTEQNGVAGPAFYSVGTVAAEGNKMTTEVRCSSFEDFVGRTQSSDYTATPTTLSMYTYSTYTLVAELTKQ